MADKNNIFIGTNYLNTSTMKKIETLVLDYITKNEKAKVLYRVTLLLYTVFWKKVKLNLKKEH